MSQYGEKFDKALDTSLAMRFKARKNLLIIGLVWLIGADWIACPGLIAIPINLPNISSETMLALGVVFFIFALAVLVTPICFITLSIFYKRPSYARCKRVFTRTAEIAEFFGENGKAIKKQLYESLKKTKNREYIINVTDHYYTECERLKAEHEKSPINNELENGGKSGFDGWLIQKLGWVLLGMVVTICSAGICFPIAYIWLLKWQCKHTIYDGRRLSFDGKMSQLMGKWVCWILLCIPTVLIYIFFIPKNLLVWKAKHMHLKGELHFLGGYWKGNPFVLFFRKLGFFLLKIITLGFLKPLIICWDNRYIQKRLIVDGRRMNFDGNGLQIMGKWALWTLLTFITLGVYAYFRGNRINKWVAKHTHIRDGFYQVKVL